MPVGYKHAETPKKALVRGVISYLESQDLPVNKSAIFRHFGLSRSQGYAALTAQATKRTDPEWEETRGRPNKVSDDDQQKMESVLWDEKYEDVPMNWSGLAKEAGVEMTCNKRTLHRAMGTLGYRRCLTCGRNWTHTKNREKRCDYARKLLQAYPRLDDWRLVRFSGEIHFGFGLDGKMRIIPRPGERPCPVCEPSADSAWPRDARRLHAWGAIGHGFKSELIFYDESLNGNGTGDITMAIYCDKILEKAVKPWLHSYQSNFILEEDVECFAHGGLSKVNMVQQWKEANGLRCYFNCGDSPDLNPLDAVWPPNKRWTGEALKDWEPNTLKQAAREAWANLSQDSINAWVDVMPQRLHQVVNTGGRFVTW